MRNCGFMDSDYMLLLLLLVLHLQGNNWSLSFGLQQGSRLRRC